MPLDILALILIGLALWKGVKNGLLIAICSFVAIWLGIAAAIQLSAYVAAKINEVVTVNQTWLPFIAFALVMIVVLLGVHWLGKLLTKVAEVVWLGWLNRVGGFVLYLLIYALLYSTLLYYADKVHFIPAAWKNSSRAYEWLQPLAPTFMDWMGRIFPIMKDAFQDLEHFFGKLAPKTTV